MVDCMKKNNPTDPSLQEKQTSNIDAEPDQPIERTMTETSVPNPETDTGSGLFASEELLENSNAPADLTEPVGASGPDGITETDDSAEPEEVVDAFEPPATGPDVADSEMISEEEEIPSHPHDMESDPVLRRVRVTHATRFDKVKASVQFFVTKDLPNGLRRLGPILSRGAASFLLFVKSLFSKKARSIHRRKKKSRNKIRQTDRERVYKLRGYTTYEKVIAKRKAQRRFRIAQRITITLMCVGLLGFVAFRNNPFTDIDEMLRIIGIRNSVGIPFHQYAFPLVLIEPDSDDNGDGGETGETESPPELTPENDFAQLVKANGREDDRFHILAYEGVIPLREDLEACRLTVAASDFAQLTTNRKVGTILVLLPKQGDVSTYRFTDVRQSGVIVDISALPITTTGGANRVYMIGLLSDKPYHGYSYDVTTQAPTAKITAP